MERVLLCISWLSFLVMLLTFVGYVTPHWTFDPNKHHSYGLLGYCAGAFCRYYEEDQSEKVPLTSFVFGTASLAISAVLFLALMYWCFYTGDADWYPTSCWKAGIVSFALIGIANCLTMITFTDGEVATTYDVSFYATLASFFVCFAAVLFLMKQKPTVGNNFLKKQLENAPTTNAYLRFV